MQEIFTLSVLVSLVGLLIFFAVLLDFIFAPFSEGLRGTFIKLVSTVFAFFQIIFLLRLFASLFGISLSFGLESFVSDITTPVLSILPAVNIGLWGGSILEITTLFIIVFLIVADFIVEAIFSEIIYPDGYKSRRVVYRVIEYVR